MSTSPNNSRKLSFFPWNINGLSSKTFGDKLQNYDCPNMISNFDFIILSETWKKSNFQDCCDKHHENRKTWSQLSDWRIGINLQFKVRRLYLNTKIKSQRSKQKKIYMTYTYVAHTFHHKTPPVFSQIYSEN